jgi:glyoxylate reductase
MAKPKVFLTRELPEEPMRVLNENFELTCNPNDRALNREELLVGVSGQDGLIPLLSDRVDDEVLEAAGGQLKIVANYAVGYNNIDLDACTRLGIAVTNTPGVLTDATADLAMALLLATARRIVEGDALCRPGRFPGWGPNFLLGADLNGRALGILGMGRIGQAVARRAIGFGLKIIYHNRRPLEPQVEAALQARYVDFATLLAESDFLSLHPPLTDQTRRLMGSEQLSQMKPTAILINTARGEVVDEAALAQALRTGQIGAAGLDVYEDEPQINPGLLDLPNLVMAPHVGSATQQTRTQMGLMVAQNLTSLLIHGTQPPNRVN